MKRLCLLLLLLTAGTSLFAQQVSVIDRFFQKYENDQSFTLVSVTPKMFSMFSKFDINSAEGKSFMTIVKKLKGLRILVKENTKEGNKLYQEAASQLTKEYEELMTVRSDGELVKFMVKENSKGNIAELVMLVGGQDEFVAMSLLGDIDLNEISQIANDMNIGGMDKLKSLNKKSTM
jgi:hypothetical protein